MATCENITLTTVPYPCRKVLGFSLAFASGIPCNLSYRSGTLQRAVGQWNFAVFSSLRQSCQASPCRWLRLLRRSETHHVWRCRGMMSPHTTIPETSFCYAMPLFKTKTSRLELRTCGPLVQAETQGSRIPAVQPRRKAPGS